MSVNTQPWTKESAAAIEIEKFERISLNNLLLKCKGAPYEEALRRIIKQKLSDNAITAGLQSAESNGSERNYDHRSKNVPFDDSLSRHSESHRRPQDSQGAPARPSGGNDALQHQQSDLRQVRDQYGVPSRSSEPSSSMREFQRWLLDNRDVHGHDEEQYQKWLGRLSSSTNGAAQQRGEAYSSERGKEVDQHLDFSRISDINSTVHRSTSVSYPESERGRSLRRAGRSISPVRRGRSPSICSQQSHSRATSHSRERGRDYSRAPLTPRSSSSHSHYSSSSSRTGNRRGSFDDRWRDDSPTRPFHPTLLAQASNKRILAASRAHETFNQRVAKSVQNYYIRQAFACTGSSSSDGGGGSAPGVGQYTRSLTLPYNQRHGRSMRNTENTIPSQKHTFGDERYDDSFMQRSFARSGSLNGGDRDGDAPSVGQYTKTLVIPYYQRHSATRSKSPSQFQRHTWGSEKYDTFINDYNGEDSGRYAEPEERHSVWTDQCEASYSSRQHSQTGSSRGRSPGGEDRRGPPRTPGEHRLRRLLKMISGMGVDAGKST